METSTVGSSLHLRPLQLTASSEAELMETAEFFKLANVVVLLTASSEAELMETVKKRQMR